ncbi:response regulator receiver modulated serine phosphatase [Shewanella sediminis HAW-EB3]|uniref:Response regulator receiver modulated serine phosphatase n=1 Tax=Shewanella sediminis (strain HAW-EB3) TaxID=425104 RepID=A8FXH7_SHESH|nr:SpoIIE family protein phosphatase [Shewanella sediminis]ABV37550.1 response regulator receiver modulated serine phosphatase [Shewanella sediminis HAW-EB3]
MTMVMEESATSFRLQTEGLSVLVVEDTHSERCFITHLLEMMGLKVTSCSSGEEAIESYQQEKADMIISDWRMPGMTGPELCQYLKNIDPSLYIILLTANNQTKHTVIGIESGADDFLTKPFIPSILKARVLAGARIVNMQRQLENRNSELNTSLTKEQAYLQQIQKDIDSAAKLQGSLLPTSSTLQNGWKLATQFQPAQELAGDIFQCLEIDDSHLGFYLLDVTGHGIAASMQSFTLAQRLSCNSCDWASLDPALIVTQLNADFEDPEHSGRFATLVLGVVNTTSGKVKLTIAGHPLPILIKGDETEVMDLISGIPLGIDSHYHYEFNTFLLSPEQQLLLYSDGLYECRHPSFGEFGQQRLINSCSKAHQLKPESLLHYLAHAIDLWQEKVPQDDISMMLLSVPKLSVSGTNNRERTVNSAPINIDSADYPQPFKNELLIDSELIDSEPIVTELTRNRFPGNKFSSESIS